MIADLAQIGATSDRVCAQLAIKAAMAAATATTAGTARALLGWAPV